jgi:hypothetical protein
MLKFIFKLVIWQNMTFIMQKFKVIIVCDQLEVIKKLVKVLFSSS